jgi:ParB family chromosome partitioning protein
LLEALGDDLRFPKAVSRNLGVEVVRAIKAGQGVEELRVRLRGVTTPEEQEHILQAFASSQAVQKPEARKAGKKEKFEFRVGASKVTARRGECRIVSKKDFTSVPRDRLERAILAFEAALDEESNPRVTSL